MLPNGSLRDKYDDIMVDIGTVQFELRRLYAEFLIEYLSQIDEREVNLEILVPHQPEEDYILISTKKIYYDGEEQKIKISFIEDMPESEWDFLNLTAQNIVINYIHYLHTSQRYMNNFTS